MEMSREIRLFAKAESIHTVPTYYAPKVQSTNWSRRRHCFHHWRRVAALAAQNPSESPSWTRRAKSDTAIVVPWCDVAVATAVYCLAPRPFRVETVVFRARVGAIVGIIGRVPRSGSWRAAAALAVAFAGPWIRGVDAATGNASARFASRAVRVPWRPRRAPVRGVAGDFDGAPL